jgi:hypothetical protein
VSEAMKRSKLIDPKAAEEWLCTGPARSVRTLLHTNTEVRVDVHEM